MSNINRRLLLKSGAALLPLPFFKSIAASSNNAKASKPVTRIIFLATGWGVTADNWFPSLEKKGNWQKLPKALKPLEKFKKDFSMVRNCYNQHSKDAHKGSTFWLTGADRFAIPGRNFHNSISVDQVVAQHYGAETRFKSIRLSSGGPSNSLSWDNNGKPLTSLRSPLEFYQTLFEQPSIPVSEIRKQLQHKQSILDIFHGQTKNLSSKLNKDDNEKLAEYMQSVRDIETAITKENQWLDIPKKKPKNMPDKPDSTDAPGELKAILDLMIAAMQVDASRAFTYGLPIEPFLKYFGTGISGHNMSHYGMSENRKVISEKRDYEYVKGLAYLIEKLHSTKDENGESLFENTTVVFGSNIKTGHNLKDCTTLIIGKGANIQLGKHIVAPPKTPLCNVWLTLLQGMGIQKNSFGDSTGTLTGLQA